MSRGVRLALTVALGCAVIAVIAIFGLKSSSTSKGSSSALPESLPKVKVNGIDATELATPLGTLLSFERAGVRYVVAGSVSPAAVEAVARGL